MQADRPRRVLRSVFTKLLAVIVVTGLALHLVLGAFFWMSRLTAGRPFQSTIYQYLSYIIADLGDPPQLERAVRIAAGTGLQISFKGRSLSWSTAVPPLQVPARHMRPWDEHPGVSSAMIRRHLVVLVQDSRGQFLFRFKTTPGEDPHLTLWHAGLLAAVTLVLAGAYLAMRSVLKPVAWLKQAVDEVVRGNFNHTVPLRGRDELRDLAEAFNEMTGRIRSILRTKDRLLLDVSHELRSPLTRMGVALEFLPEGRARQSLKADIEEMTRMITTILETARTHHAHTDLRLERTDLARLLREVLAEFADQPPGLRLGRLESGLVCRADSAKLATVLRNVLANALKYSLTDSPPVDVAAERRPPFAVVHVRDFGIGIPADELEAVFEPFYRVDKSRSRRTGGFGLGLSLCKTIMDAHGGRIEVDSSPGNGTRVSLQIPLANTD